jgi:hypothetical protein
MMKNRGMKKIKIGALAFLIATTSLVVIPSSVAADIPTVKLISPVISGSNSIDRTLEDLQIPAQKWYREGSKSIVITSQEGQELTLKYLVTKDGKTPWADKDLTLLIGAPYSGSTGSWSIAGSQIGPQAGEWSETYAGLATIRTDENGIATFTLKNINSGSKFKSSDVLSGFFIFSGNKDRFYTQFKPMISGLKDYDEPYLIKDIISVDIVKDSITTTPTTPTPTTPTPTPTPTVVAPKLLPSMRLISPGYGPTNSVDTTGDIAQFYSAKTRAYYTYVAAGTTLTLKYLVTSDGLKPLADTEVSLQANAQYSNSKANWLEGTTKIGPGSDTISGATLKAKTNSAGEVTFVIKNTDTTGTEAKPTAANALAPKIRLFGTFKPVITGYGDKEADVDLVTFDVYASAKAASITCIKGKVTKKVTAVNPKCPAGYKKK